MKKVITMIICISILLLGSLGAIRNSIPLKDENNKIQLDSFMAEQDILLTGKDVAIDKGNNLDEVFAMEGIGELSNYYNYGFDESIEREYFCVQLKPTESRNSDKWYLYFHREVFGELLEELSNGNRYMMVSCTIPTFRYQEGMGNMAQVQSIRWETN